ncbi:MAG: hypothetical protein ACXAD7_23160 [Candidatus Kariarchaeaceae archaeon]
MSSFEVGIGFPYSWIFTMDTYDYYMASQTAAIISADGFTMPDDFKLSLFLNQYTQY